MDDELHQQHATYRKFRVCSLLKFRDVIPRIPRENSARSAPSFRAVVSGVLASARSAAHSAHSARVPGRALHFPRAAEFPVGY
jgi:hypothetical protein